ncbi:hypothetical protein SERLA73DRAFT_74955 [Serpula lacrymans var. lacrymans S7.3]|uniref:Uncharacterized protein n=2 Tax=Serpula lacrymans var. lacrymans TaxID=341189 RepID=F8Q231_SERL3|nr:hypothetical protein SERLA73DRAFT_74955 [Serpula lacrymans var. lacrymans S7.3]
MSVVARCKGLSGKDIAVNFLLMVNLMQLVTKCQSIKIRTDLSLNGIYNQEIAHLSNKPSKRMFQDWHSTGSKFAALAGGGSIYLLVLIASLGLHVSVAAMEGTSPWDLANLLRMPKKETVKGNLIIDHIIPTISRMRLSLLISMASMFSPAILAEHQLANEFDCTNISSSDHFFDSVIFNNFVLLKRDCVAWQSCYTFTICAGNPAIPLHQLGYNMLAPLEHSFLSRPYSPPLTDINEEEDCPLPNSYPSRFLSEENTTTIPTSYNHSLAANKVFQAEHDHNANVLWTEKERERAVRGHVATDTNDLRTQLQSLYQGGVKATCGTYLRIPASVILGQSLNIRNSDGSLMVFVCTSLPDCIRSSLQPKLLAAFENNEPPTQKPGQHDEDDMFEALHFSWYNRHCTIGDDAPTEISPLMLEREDGRRTNYSQMIPYLSKEIKDHSTIYRTIKVVFADLFHWIHDVIELQLPEEYKLLAEVASILPGNNLSPIFPFLSLVINLNVSTKGH